MNIGLFLKRIVAQAAHWFFPFRCILCDEETRRELDLCIDCEQSLPRLQNSCLYCAIPLPFKESRCGTCLKTPLPFHKVCIPFSYTQAIRKLIIELKFQRRLLYASILGKLLLETLKLQYQNDSLPQAIIPVPLHKKRLYERGFNQAMELARPIAKKLQIPINYKCCKRVRNTPAQSTLAAYKRRSNVKNAFVIQRKQLPQYHVALLDDVMTTGQTLIELSYALHHIGVKRIDIWCCSRT